MHSTTPTIGAQFFTSRNAPSEQQSASMHLTTLRAPQRSAQNTNQPLPYLHVGCPERYSSLLTVRQTCAIQTGSLDIYTVAWSTDGTAQGGAQGEVHTLPGASPMTSGWRDPTKKQHQPHGTAHVFLTDENDFDEKGRLHLLYQSRKI